MVIVTCSPVFFNLFDEGFDICFGLFIGNHPHIVQIAIDSDAWHAGLLFEPLRHSVSAVGIIRAGFCIMLNDPVNSEIFDHFPDIALLCSIGADNE